MDALDAAGELSKLELAHTRRHNVLAERAERGRGTDFRQGQALDEIAGVLRDMVTGDTRTFRVAAFVTVRAAGPEELRAGLREVGKALRDAGGTAVDRCYLGQADGWRATLPLGANPLGMGYRATSLNLSHTFPFLNHRAGTPGGPLLGFSDPGHEVVTLDLGDPGLTNGNLILTGKQGSGKTMVAQRLCLDCACMGTRVVVLDRSTGHFADLVAAVPGAAAHRVGLDGSFRINPWELPRGRRAPTQEKLDYLLDLLTLLAGERHGEDQHLTGEERGILESGCRAVYASASEPGPYMRHLHAWLLNRRDESPAHGALAQRLAPYVGEGAYAGLLDGHTTVRPGDVLEVFNFAGVSPRVAALAMLPLIEHIWSVIADPEHLTLLVMDEGWSLLQGQASARFMSEVTRTGRHHGLLTLNISQFVTDYEGPLGRAVLDSRSVALLLQQNDGQVRRAGELFGLTEDEADALARLKTVKHRRAGAYLHSRDGAVSGSLAVYHTPEQYWLFTSYRPERELRAEAIARHGGDVWAAVRELAEAVPPGSVADRAPDEGAGPSLRAL